jgi:hypothetical protein
MDKKGEHKMLKLFKFNLQIKDILKIRLVLDSRVPPLYADSYFQEHELPQNTLQTPSRETKSETYQALSEPLFFVPIFIGAIKLPEIKINVLTSYPVLEIFNKKSEEKSLQKNLDSGPMKNMERDEYEERTRCNDLYYVNKSLMPAYKAALYVFEKLYRGEKVEIECPDSSRKATISSIEELCKKFPELCFAYVNCWGRSLRSN